MGAGVNIRVYTAQKEVNICLAEVPSFTIEEIYTNIQYVKAHKVQKIQNPRVSKSSSSTDSPPSTKYILEK
jgi:hypothetical protein